MHLTTVAAGFRQQLRISLRRSGQVAIALTAVPQALMFGWLLHRSGSDAALARVVFGQTLLSSWTASVLTLTWMITEESWTGTYELGIVTRASMAVAMFGKGIALVAGGFLGGVVSTVALLVMARDVPTVERPLLALLSFLVAAGLAVPATAFLITPISALSPGCRAFTNGLIPVGIVLGGFLFPVAALPDWVEPVSRLLPMSWVTDALAGAASGVPASSMLADLSIGAALSLLWAGVALRLFGRVERRFVEHGALPA